MKASAYKPVDFRFPLVEYGNLMYSMSAGSQNEYSLDMGSYGFRNQLDFKYFRQTDDITTILESAFTANYQFSYQNGMERESWRVYDNISGSLNMYPFKKTDLFIKAGLSISHSYDYSFDSHYNLRKDRYFRNTQLAGIGFGRLRNLDTYNKALRVIRMLRKYVKIDDSVSEALIKDLAQLIYKKDEYKKKYSQIKHAGSNEEYWRKYYYRDMQRILNRIKAIKKNSSFFLLAKIDETTEQYFPERFYGFELFYTIERRERFSVLSQKTFFTASESSATDKEFGHVVQFKLGYPLLSSFHVSLDASFFPADNYGQKYYYFEFQPALIFELSNYFYVTLDYMFNYSFAADGSSSFLSHKISIGASYLISRNMSMVFTSEFYDNLNYGMGIKHWKNNLELKWRIF